MTSVSRPPIDWSSIDHVLLDMDGTVLDLAYDTHFWSTLVPQRYAEHHGISLADSLEFLTPHFINKQGTLDWYCLDHWSGLTGLDIVAMKAEVRERILPLPGSEDFLRGVRAAGKQLWLVTNAHPGSWLLKMEHTGFAPHFDRLLCSHDFGAPKEDARFWPRLRKAHDFDPARTLFADDSLPVLRAARDYGIARVIAIRHPDSTQKPRSVDEFEAVDRLAELLPIG
jgi:putative hydrolase of the HAD superfamily